MNYSIILILISIIGYIVVKNYTTWRYKFLCYKTKSIKIIKIFILKLTNTKFLLQNLKNIEMLLNIFENEYVQKYLITNKFLYGLSIYVKVLLNSLKEFIIYYLKKK